MSNAVVAPPFCWTTCAWNVVHRNAPGAMSAMALIVSPVIVRVRFISVAGAAAILILLYQHSHFLYPIADRPVAAVPERRIGHAGPEFSIATPTFWRRCGVASSLDRLLSGCATDPGRERTRRDGSKGRAALIDERDEGDGRRGARECDHSATVVDRKAAARNL